MRGLLTSLLVLSLTATPAVGQDGRRFEPQSDWAITQNDDSCAVRRQFIHDGDQVFLELRAFQPDGPLHITVASPDMSRRNSEDVLVALKPHDEEREQTFSFNVELGGGYEGKLFLFLPLPSTALYDEARRAYMDSDESARLSPADIAVARRMTDLGMPSEAYSKLYREDATVGSAMFRFNQQFIHSHHFREALRTYEDAIDGIELGRVFTRNIYLDTGLLKAPMEELRHCMDDLQTQWGIDVVAHQSLSHWPTEVDPDGTADRNSFRLHPTQMTLRMEGLLNIRFDVSPEGMATACHMSPPIRNRAFEAQVCSAMMLQARFDPALDAEGQPIASIVYLPMPYRVR